MSCGLFLMSKSHSRIKKVALQVLSWKGCTYIVALNMWVLETLSKYRKLKRSTAQKMKFSMKGFFGKCPTNLVPFTEENLGKLHFVCSEESWLELAQCFLTTFDNVF